MPRNLAAAAAEEGWQEWLATVPETVARARRLWSIDVGEPFQPGGMTAWVAPARAPSGDLLVLKVGWRHPEAEHEGRALRAWGGDGAVRLHASMETEDTIVLLMEQCVPGTALSCRPEPEQDTVVAGLLRRLWIEPPPADGFRPLEVMCGQWADRFEQQIASGQSTSGQTTGGQTTGGQTTGGGLASGQGVNRRPGLDPGLARAGAALFRELPNTADRRDLLCTDLHAGNVLAAQREPWLVIDPKPYVGDPTYDLLQHMLNCEERLLADPRGFARRLADLFGLDCDRLLLWLFARCVIDSPDWPSLADVAHQIAPA